MKFRKVSIEDALKGAQQNEFKFSAERNGKYNVYFPSVDSTTVAKIHEWRAGGKFQSAACTGKEEGCPFCPIQDAGWEEYRAKIDEAIAGLDPINDKDEIHKIKMSLVPQVTSSTYIYQLVGIVSPADKESGKPESYTLKIMRLSESRMKNFKEYAEETADTKALNGATLLLKYPDEENARDRGKNMQILPGKPVSDAIKAAIDADAAKFNWESALNGFYEFRDLSPEEAKKAIASLGYEAVDDDDEDEKVPFVAPTQTTTPAETSGADDLDDLV